MNDVGAHIKNFKKVVPDFTTIWWRIEGMKIILDPRINSEKGNIVIAVDSTGIKEQIRASGYVTNGSKREYYEKDLSKYMWS